MRRSRVSLHYLVYTISIVFITIVLAFLKRDALVVPDYVFLGWKVIVDRTNKNGTDWYHFSALQDDVYEEHAIRRNQSIYRHQEITRNLFQVTYMPQTTIPTAAAQNGSVSSLFRWSYGEKKNYTHIVRTITTFKPRVPQRVIMPRQYLLYNNMSYPKPYHQKISTRLPSASRHEYRFSYLLNKTAYVPSNKSIENQQQRFNLFLQSLLELEQSVSTTHRIIQYVPHRESGFGNVVRGLMTTTFVAFMTGRAFRFYSEPSFFMSLFKALPNMEDNTSAKGNRVYCREYPMNRAFIRRIQRKSFDTIFHRSYVCYITYSDITAKYISIPFYRERLENFGLIPVVEGNVSSIWVGQQYRYLMYRLLLNPEYTLCSTINRHLVALHQRKLIGVQIRTGGAISNFHEREFLGRFVVKVALNKIARYMKSHNLQRRDVYVYLSSDSSIVIRNIWDYIRRTGEDFVYNMTDFSIGHTATAKTLNEGLTTWTNYYNRALVDLFILKDSDYLIFSEGSSFGRLAYELQQTYGNSVTSDEFLKQRGLNCSVFLQRSSPGDYSIILKSESRRQSTLNFNV